MTTNTTDTSYTRTYTLKDCEEILHVTHRSLLNYLKDGKLTGVKVGKKWIIRESDLKALLEKGTR